MVVRDPLSRRRTPPYALHARAGYIVLMHDHFDAHHACTEPHVAMEPWGGVRVVVVVRGCGWLWVSAPVLVWLLAGVGAGVCVRVGLLVCVA